MTCSLSADACAALALERRADVVIGARDAASCQRACDAFDGAALSAVAPSTHGAASKTSAGPCALPGSSLVTRTRIDVDLAAESQSGHVCVLQSEKPSFVTTHDSRGEPSVNSMPAFTHVPSSTRIMMPA